MILFNPKINFIKFNKYALLLSISLMILSSILILVKGLNLGIDFLGGTRIDFSINKKVEISLVKDTINDFISNKNYSIKEIENLEEGFSSFSIISKTNLQKDLIGEVERNLKQKFTTDLIVKETLSENIGKNVSDDLANDALLSLLIASILILVYITIRFNGFFALGSIVALVHDILITLGIFSLFSLEINLPIIAAFLTILGYSLNDTIVVFDRIRENFNINQKDISNTINKSINQTLARTLLTSLTTLIVLVILYFVGSYLIKLFTLALIIGVIIGTYSSIFIASYSVSVLHNKFGYILERFRFDENEE